MVLYSLFCVLLPRNHWLMTSNRSIRAVGPSCALSDHDSCWLGKEAGMTAARPPHQRERFPPEFYTINRSNPYRRFADIAVPGALFFSSPAPSLPSRLKRWICQSLCAYAHPDPHAYGRRRHRLATPGTWGTREGQRRQPVRGWPIRRGGRSRDFFVGRLPCPRGRFRHHGRVVRVRLRGCVCGVCRCGC